MEGEKMAAEDVGGDANGNVVSQIQILRSLRRSRVRTEIALYLYKIYPAASYPTDIARNIGIAPTNVLGGLRGMNQRFDESSSLLGLGLVDKVSDEGTTYYQLSENGKIVMGTLNKSEVLK